MRQLAKVPGAKGNCPRCGRELVLDTRGKPWAHKCPHGARCEGFRRLGLADVPVCTLCNKAKNSTEADSEKR